MPERNTVLRSMHDIGLAGWFGGSLMGAVGLNGAAARAPNPAERLQIASAGWDRWAPVNLAAIGAHLAGAAGILVSEAPRVATQKGVGAMSVAKTAFTVAALGATAAHGAARQPAYSEDARSYDRKTGAFQAYRRAIVGALPVRPGQVVLDVGCGTGLCYGLLLEKVGPQGSVVGIEESPEMAAIARERIAREGWHNVTVVQSGAEDAQIAVTADAALFCAVHDILQSPDALRNVMNHLRPGAPVAAGGGKWAAPWMMAVNIQARMLHAPYVRSFEGFGRPWNHLEQLLDDVHVRELAFGSGYVLTGRSSRSRRSGSPAVQGAAGSRAGPG